MSSALFTHARDQIADLVRGHRVTDRTEARHRAAIERWLDSAADPLDRTCDQPGHVVASAFIVSTTGCVALIYHSKLERWLQPGGHVEPGDRDLAHTAAREVREELGIDIPADALELFDLDVHRIPTRGRLAAHLHYDFRYLGVMPDTPLAKGSDALDVRWFAAAELRGLPADSGMTRMIDKADHRGLLSP